jgi:hypothetical protein
MEDTAGLHPMQPKKVWLSLARLRQGETNPLTYRLSASGFLAEIDRMQREVRDDLALHRSELFRK